MFQSNNNLLAGELIDQEQQLNKNRAKFSNNHIYVNGKQLCRLHYSQGEEGLSINYMRVGEDYGGATTYYAYKLLHVTTC
jgi:hypothetical protein